MSVSRTRFHSTVMSVQRFLKKSRRARFVTVSEIVRHRAVKSAALPKLRCANADAAAVAQLVNLIEQIHDIETNFDRLSSTQRNSTFHSQVQSFVGMILLRVGKAAPQSIPIKCVGGKTPVVPAIGDPGRVGEALIVIEEDPVIAN